MALLKVKISVARLAALMDALRPEPNEFQVTSHSFQTLDGIPGYREKKTIPLVRILPGDRKFDGEDIEVNLELVVKYPDTDGDREIIRDVPREILDNLWDILGIFPRSDALSADRIFELVTSITELAEARVKKAADYILHHQEDAAGGELSMIKKEQGELRKQITFLTGHE